MRNLLDWLRATVTPGPTEDGTHEDVLQSDASRPPGPIPVESRPGDLAASLCIAMRPLLAQAATREICLLIQPAASFPERVHADVLKLTWAITTLVGTALRHVRHGTRMMPGGTVRVGIAWIEATRTAVLSVADDGSGIPAEVLKGLLSREITPGRTPSLALLLVEDIAHAHGGSLKIASGRRGTTITLAIPCPEPGDASRLHG